MPAARLGALWPASLSPGGRHWVLANIHDGVLDEASVQLAIGLDPSGRTANMAKAVGTLRYHDLTVRYLKGLEPVRKVSGSAVFDGDRLEFTPTGGRLRGLEITGGALRLTQLGQKVELLSVDLPVTGPLRDVLQIINAEPLGYASDIGIDPGKVSGGVETTLHFKLPLLDALKLAQVEYGVRATLTGVGIAGVALDHDISGGDFTLAIDKPGVRLSGAARFADIPLRSFRAAVSRDKRTQSALSRHGVARRSGAAASRHRPRGGAAQRPGRARRALYRVCRDPEFAGGHGAGKRGEADILLDLRSATLALPEAGWKKRPGDAGTARVVLDIKNDHVARIRRVDAQAPGLQAVLSGRVAANGAIDRIDIHRLTLGGNNLAGSVVPRTSGGWHADIDAAALDAQPLLKDARDAAPADAGAARPSSPPAGAPLAVNARVGRLLLGPGRELRQVTASVLREGGKWRSAQVDAHAAGGGALWVRFGPAKDGGGDGQKLMVQSDDLGAMLKLLDVTDTVTGGRLRIDGQLSREADKRVLRAHFKARTTRSGIPRPRCACCRCPR